MARLKLKGIDENDTMLETKLKIKPYLSTDCRLQLAFMKAESLVILDQDAKLNLYLDFVHSALHMPGVCRSFTVKTK